MCVIVRFGAAPEKTRKEATDGVLIQDSPHPEKKKMGQPVAY